MSPIRDLALVATLFFLVPVSFARPWIGVLAWFWVAYFVPQSFTWGFGRNLPVAMIVAVATLLGYVMSSEGKKPLPRTASVLFLALFSVHVTVSTILAYDPATAWGKWDWVSKSILMTFVAMVLFQERERLKWLYVITAVSLGLHGLKGGLWVLRTGGGERVYGPERSFFWDNNTLGLALCMILPTLLYLSRDEDRVWLKRAMRVIFAFSIIAILFTYSRGAFIGLLLVLIGLVWRSPWRWRFAVAAVVLSLVVAAVMPARLRDRIASIGEQKSAETRDISVAGRIEAWETATQIAIQHPFFGEGFRALWAPELWSKFYGMDFTAARDAHSLYFEVMAEHGFLGLGLYLVVVGDTMVILTRVRRRWRGDPTHGYLSRYAEMTRLGLVPYLVSGASLGVAYFDLYFLMVGLSAILRSLSEEAGAAVKAAEADEATPRRALAPRGASRTLVRPRRPGLQQPEGA
jgi:probable O-glycosylation ligase (exosortase A-associated)